MTVLCFNPCSGGKLVPETRARKKQMKLEPMIRQPMVLSVQKTLTQLNNNFHLILCFNYTREMMMEDTHFAELKTLATLNNYQMTPCIISSKEMMKQCIPRMKQTGRGLYHLPTTQCFVRTTCSTSRRFQWQPRLL